MRDLYLWEQLAPGTKKTMSKYKDLYEKNSICAPCSWIPNAPTVKATKTPTSAAIWLKLSLEPMARSGHKAVSLKLHEDGAGGL